MILTHSATFKKSDPILQKRLADGKTVSDLISIFLRLSPDRQHALLLILSDMDLLHSVINQCGRRDQ